jgi:hypothetical protein
VTDGFWAHPGKTYKNQIPGCFFFLKKKEKEKKGIKYTILPLYNSAYISSFVHPTAS